MTTPDLLPLIDKIQRIITLDHIQLLQDYDVDADLYRLDPESGDAARAVAEAIMDVLSPCETERDAALARVKELEAKLSGDEMIWCDGCQMNVKRENQAMCPLKDCGVLVSEEAPND